MSFYSIHTAFKLIPNNNQKKKNVNKAGKFFKSIIKYICYCSAFKGGSTLCTNIELIEFFCVKMEGGIRVQLVLLIQPGVLNKLWDTVNEFFEFMRLFMVWLAERCLMRWFNLWVFIPVLMFFEFLLNSMFWLTFFA